MDLLRFRLPPEAELFKEEVLGWIDENPDPTPRKLAEAGLVAPHWPRPWGRAAGPLEQLAIDDALRQRGVRRPTNIIGLGWAGPTILHAGTDEQQHRYLPGILDASEQWCQLFSEPESGSDLASLGTRAVRDGDEWVVNGQKIWTSGAGASKYGILLARTHPDLPKHRGITYFVCPMEAHGIEIRPIREMTGGTTFNEVFMNDVRIPAANIVGSEGQGWELAKVTLANERVSLSGEGALWGFGPTADDLLEIVRNHGGVADPQLRQRFAHAYTDSCLLKVLRLRLVAAAIAGRPPGAESSVRKLAADRHGRDLFRLARDLADTSGMLIGTGPMGGDPGSWEYGFLFSPALTIGGGTAEVQLNVIGERILGLPREPEPGADLPWSQSN